MSSTPPIIPLNNSKLASIFSLRLTFKEQAILEQAAGDMPLGAYIRARLLNESEVPRRVRKRTRKPLKVEQVLALLLGELGKARIANNLNQLAKAVNTGSLPVTPDTEKALQRASAAVQDMRDLLLKALGFSAGVVP